MYQSHNILIFFGWCKTIPCTKYIKVTGLKHPRGPCGDTCCPFDPRILRPRCHRDVVFFVGTTLQEMPGHFPIQRRSHQTEHEKRNKHTNMKTNTQNTHTHHTNIPDLSARTFLDLSGSFKPYWKILGPNRIEHRVVFSIHLPWKPKFYMKVLFGIHVTNVNLTGRPNKYLSSHNHGSVKNNLPLQAVMKRCPMFRKSQGLQEEKRLPP